MSYTHYVFKTYRILSKNSTIKMIYNVLILKSDSFGSTNERYQKLY